MRIFSFILLLMPLLVIRANAQDQNPNYSLDSTSFDSIYPFALRGEMDEVFNRLNNTPGKNLSSAQQEIKQKYYDRFLYRTENFQTPSVDSIVSDVYSRFRNYWHSVLIEKVPSELADSLFFNEMIQVLKLHYRPDSSIQALKKNYYRLYHRFMKEHGCFSITIGKTGHLFDIYLWTEEEEVIYDIDLPEAKAKIPVIFMKGFVSNGWSHYTTFGDRYSGGWVGRDKIFCVEEAWNIEKESFKVSYVAHEGQHFVDQKKYPNLKQTDLEYRAKLTELALAKASVYQVIQKFIENGKNDKTNAHAFANYQVIQELSSLLFNDTNKHSLEEWKTVSTKQINSSAKTLLLKNSKALSKAGAEVETLFIN